MRSKGDVLKLEVERKGGLKCHENGLNVVVADEGEIMTGGGDGFVRIWDYESIDSYSTSSKVSIEPLDEISIGKDVNVLSSNPRPPPCRFRA